MTGWNQRRGPRHGANVSLSFALATLAAPLLLTTCGPKNDGNGPGSEAVTTVRGALVSAALSPRQPNIRWQGRMQAIDIDPADPNFAVVASDHGGAWSTTDGGANWTRYDNLFPTGLMDVAICPTNRQVIVITASASTGTSLATDQGGIWRTDNGGTSWTRPAYNVPQNRFNAYGISFQPGVANCGTVFIGTDFGLAQCSSNATTCTNIVVPITTGGDQVFSLVAHASGIVDVHTNFGHRRYDGTVFSPVRYPVNQPPGTQGLPNGFFANTHTMTIAPQNPNVIIGVSQQLVPDTNPTGNLVFGPGAQAFESDDGGATWTALGNPTFDQNGRPAFVFAVPSRTGNANQFDLYVGDRVDIFRQTCTEAGGTGTRCAVGNPADFPPLPPPWEFVTLRQSGTCGRAGVSPCGHQDPSDIVFNPTTNCPLYIAGDGGVLKLLAGRPTATCGQTGDYDVTAGTIPALQLYEITGQVHPGGTIRTDLFFSTQDNDIWASASGGDVWDANVEFEGAGLQIAHSMADRTNTLLTAYTCAGCFNFEGSPGFAAVTPWGWPDNFNRRVAGNRKDRIVFSCPDVDRDGVCDVCVDTAVPLLQCDIATSGVPCQDAQGLALTFASGTTPLPTCVGQPCVDAVNNTSGTPGLTVCAIRSAASASRRWRRSRCPTAATCNGTAAGSASRPRTPPRRCRPCRRRHGCGSATSVARPGRRCRASPWGRRGRPRRRPSSRTGSAPWPGARATRWSSISRRPSSSTPPATAATACAASTPSRAPRRCSRAPTPTCRRSPARSRVSSASPSIPPIRRACSPRRTPGSGAARRAARAGPPTRAPPSWTRSSARAAGCPPRCPPSASTTATGRACWSGRTMAA